jgi:predicted outer membrane repeat protein
MNKTTHRFTKGLHLFVFAALLMVALGLSPPPVAHAATHTVCGAVGCDFTTIQAAIDDAGTVNGDTISITDATHTEEGITVYRDLTIQGQGQATTTVQAHAARGAATDRVFHIASGSTVTIKDMTIRHGNLARDGGGIYNEGTLTLENVTVKDNDADDEGGGIYNEEDADLTLTDCTVSGNTADSGGGIYNYDGVLALTNCTVSGNEATGSGGWGGGICNDSEADQGSTLTNCTVSDNKATGTDGNGGGIYHYGDLTLTNCTVSGNEANDDGGGIYSTEDITLTNCTVTDNTADADNDGDGDGGGIYRESYAVNLKNTILAGNTDPTSDPDCYGTLTSYGYNLIQTVSANCTIGGDTTGNIIGQAPNLGPLQDNGGPTETHALLLNSPALDAIPEEAGGDYNGAPGTDQRGLTRPQGDSCDIGAFEAEPPPPPPEPVGGVVVPVNKLGLLAPWLGLAALAALATLTIALVRRRGG